MLRQQSHAACIRCIAAHLGHEVDGLVVQLRAEAAVAERAVQCRSALAPLAAPGPGARSFAGLAIFRVATVAAAAVEGRIAAWRCSSSSSNSCCCCCCCCGCGVLSDAFLFLRDAIVFAGAAAVLTADLVVEAPLRAVGGKRCEQRCFGQVCVGAAAAAGKSTAVLPLLGRHGGTASQATASGAPHNHCARRRRRLVRLGHGSSSSSSCCCCCCCC